MNPGIIKWNVVVTATVDTKKTTKKDLKDVRKSIKDFNKNGEFFKMTTEGMEMSENDEQIVLKSEFSKEINSPYKLDFSFDGIKSLMKWFTLILDDRDWDHSFIIDALKFKIQNTCKYIETKQRHLNWEQDVKYMKLALKLMDKLWPDMFTEEESYDFEYSSYHVSDHELLSPDAKGNREMKITEISENFDEYFAKNKGMHKKAIVYLAKDKNWCDPKSKFTQAMVISKLKHEKAKNLLFKILAQKIEQWWD